MTKILWESCATDAPKAPFLRLNPLMKPFVILFPPYLFTRAIFTTSFFKSGWITLSKTSNVSSDFSVIKLLSKALIAKTLVVSSINELVQLISTLASKSSAFTSSKTMLGLDSIASVSNKTSPSSTTSSPWTQTLLTFKFLKSSTNAKFAILPSSIAPQFNP